MLLEEQKNLANQHLQNLEERQLWTEHVTANGRVYYYNKKTSTSQWDKPRCLMTEDELVNEIEWKEYTTSDGKIFYYNKKLNKSVWKLPEDIKQQIEQYKARQQQEQLQNQKLDSNRKTIRKDSNDDFDSNDQINLEEKEKELYSSNFKQMLKEKKVGQNIKWDQLLKICGEDERWNRIKQISEKKKIFYEYLSELKKIERQEQKKQTDKEKEDFIKLLEDSKLTSDAKYHKSWPQFTKDQRFRVVDEKLREQYFQDYMDDLYDKERDDEKKKRKFNLEYIRPKILNLPNFSQDLTWDELNKELDNDKIWPKITDYDKIIMFQDLIYDSEKKDQEEKNKQRRYQERRNREDFRDLLIEKIYQNQINHKTKWRNFVHVIKDDERFINLLGQAGSTPHELYEDQIDVLKTYHNDLKSELKKYMKQINFKMEKEISFEQFCLKMEDMEIFKNLEELLKCFFYNIIINKVLKQEKEVVKKAKKIQKKSFKLFKHLRKMGINFENDFNEQIKSLIKQEIDNNSSFEKLKNLTIEQQEAYYYNFQTKLSLHIRSKLEENNYAENNNNNNSSQDRQQEQISKRDQKDKYKDKNKEKYKEKEGKKSNKKSVSNKRKRKQSQNLEIEKEVNQGNNNKKLKYTGIDQYNVEMNLQQKQLEQQQQQQQQTKNMKEQQQQSSNKNQSKQQEQQQQQKQKDQFNDDYFKLIENQLQKQQTKIQHQEKMQEEKKLIPKKNQDDQIIKQNHLNFQQQQQFQNQSNQINDEREEGEIKDIKSDNRSEQSSSSPEKGKKKKVKKDKKQKKDKKKKKKKHNSSDSESD